MLNLFQYPDKILNKFRMTVKDKMGRWLPLRNRGNRNPPTIAERTINVPFQNNKASVV